MKLLKLNLPVNTEVRGRGRAAERFHYFLLDGEVVKEFSEYDMLRAGIAPELEVSATMLIPHHTVSRKLALEFCRASDFAFIKRHAGHNTAVGANQLPTGNVVRFSVSFAEGVA